MFKNNQKKTLKALIVKHYKFFKLFKFFANIEITSVNGISNAAYRRNVSFSKTDLIAGEKGGELYDKPDEEPF